MGLVSPGGVHSHQDHAVGLAKILAAAGVPTRGARLDRRPRYAAAIGRRRHRAPHRRAAEVDPDRDRVRALLRDGPRQALGARRKGLRRRGRRGGPALSRCRRASIAAAYAEKKFDEFIIPAVVGDYRGMRDGDGVLCFNFRADRVREILAAILDPKFSGFARKRAVKIACAVGMTQYSDELDTLMQAIFPSQSLTKILGEVVADAGRTQLRTAETEKYPHVTYFLNGGREEPFPGEDRIMVPSPKVATYDLQPEMSAPELTDKVVAAIDSGKYDLIVLNYANPDMVGHTGSLPAAIKAVETVDTGLGRIADAIERAGGALRRHRRPRQLRDDARSRDRRAAHRAHHQSGAAVPARRAQSRAGDGRPARRHRADAAGADGIAAAAGDDRRIAAASELKTSVAALDGPGAKPVSQPRGDRIRSRLEVGRIHSAGTPGGRR